MRIVCLAAMSVLTTVCQANGSLVLEYSTPFENSTETKPSPAGEPPWLTATFTNSATDDSTAILRMEADLPGDQFVSQFYFNFDPSLDLSSLTITYEGGLATNKSPELAVDAFKAGGDGKYDILFTFPTKKADRFIGGLFSEYEISYGGVLPAGTDFAELFYFLSKPDGGFGPYYTAAHIQSIPEVGGEDSTWVSGDMGGSDEGGGGGGGGGAVPEPTSLLIWGLFGGLTLLAGRPVRG